MAQYKCKYFQLKELVNPALLKTLPESTLWSLFDDRLLRMADKIREKYGPCTVNASGLTDCGLRDINSTTGAKYSAHKIGRALDIHVRRLELQWSGNRTGKVAAYNRLREQLMADPEFDKLNFEQNSKEYPTGIPWLHCDTCNRPKRLFNA